MREKEKNKTRGQTLNDGQVQVGRIVFLLLVLNAINCIEESVCMERMFAIDVESKAILLLIAMNQEDKEQSKGGVARVLALTQQEGTENQDTMAGILSITKLPTYTLR